MHKTHKISSQTISHHEAREVRHEVPPLSKELLIFDFHLESKMFVNGIALSVSTILQGGTNAQKYLASTNRTP